jgi:hypothetical protein
MKTEFHILRKDSKCRVGNRIPLRGTDETLEFLMQLEANGEAEDHGKEQEAAHQQRCGVECIQ